MHHKALAHMHNKKARSHFKNTYTNSAEPSSQQTTKPNIGGECNATDVQIKNFYNNLKVRAFTTSGNRSFCSSQKDNCVHKLQTIAASAYCRMRIFSDKLKVHASDKTHYILYI
jgi:hypothetical protein